MTEYRRFLHNVLGWHRPEKGTTYQAGINTKAVCQDCGKGLIRDSQGGWF